MKKDKIKEVLVGMFDVIEKDKIELYQSIIDKKCYDNINDLQEFYFGLIYPFENFLDGLIQAEVSKDRDVRFIMLNSQFIERHYEKLIIKFEGSAYCADKSRTIMRNLVMFYKTGEKISFDYNQEYTYHLPKVIFKTHDNIIEFYQAIKDFYYGNSEKYLKAMLNII